MNRLETLKIQTIRRELREICTRMIRIARAGKKGYEFYNIEDPEYQRLTKTRDFLADQLRREWNGY